jgi:hypothetical protein
LQSGPRQTAQESGRRAVAQLHASRPGALQAGHDTASDHASLKLGKRAGDMNEHPASGCGRVDRLLMEEQRH